MARRLWLLALLACLLAPGIARAEVVAYDNGRCWDGAGFRAGTLYVRDGRFVARPGRVDRHVDLANGFVVSPFGEAHNHNVDPANRPGETIARYLAAGVFYVQNPGNLPGARLGLAGRIDRPDGLDVSFGNGGLTGPGGHPIEIAEANLKRGRWTAADGEGAFLHSVANAADLARVWPLVLAGKPDFIKVHLLYADEYAARLGDPGTRGWRGLDPALLPDVIRRARAAKLRVVAHIETAADFRFAVTAGVNQIAHLPGFRGDAALALPRPERFRIAAADARLAARRGVVVVTTLAGFARYAEEKRDSSLRGAIDALNRENLITLREAGVAIAVGSDEYSDNGVEEARYLATLGALTPAQVLRAWSETTAAAIFPGRRLGRLTPGYEASFLVLDGDPTADFGATARIRLGVKQGRVVSTAAPTR